MRAEEDRLEQVEPIRSQHNGATQRDKNNHEDKAAPTPPAGCSAPKAKALLKPIKKSVQ